MRCLDQPCGGGIARPLAEWSDARTRSVYLNGRLVESGALWPMAGGAAASVSWLAGDLARFGTALVPGQIILTGSPLGLYPVSPGDHVAVAVDSRVLVECSVI